MLLIYMLARNFPVATVEYLRTDNRKPSADVRKHSNQYPKTFGLITENFVPIIRKPSDL